MDERFYIVNAKGETLGEADTKEEAEMLMNLRFTQKEIEEQEIEVI